MKKKKRQFGPHNQCWKQLPPPMLGSALSSPELNFIWSHYLDENINFCLKPTRLSSPPFSNKPDLEILEVTKEKNTQRERHKQTDRDRDTGMSQHSFHPMVFSFSLDSVLEWPSVPHQWQSPGWVSLSPHHWIPGVCFLGLRNHYQTSASWSCSTSGPGRRPIWQHPELSRWWHIWYLECKNELNNGLQLITTLKRSSVASFTFGMKSKIMCMDLEIPHSDPWRTT